MNQQRAASPPPSVSISVVLYNSAATLRPLIDSLRPILASGFAEVVFIDNASPDEGADIVAREFPEAAIVRSSKNVGFAVGSNLAWQRMRGRYWLLLNPDTVISSAGLHQLVNWMDRHPGIGAASPALTSPNGQIQSVPRRFQHIGRTLLELTRVHLLISKAKRAEMFLGSYWPGGNHENVDWVPGAALMVRREAVADAGLLSDEFFMYGEDIEWCWRIRRAGWRIGYCDEVRFIHGDGSSAQATWTSAERDSRMLRGTYAAYQMMHGRLRTGTLMALSTLALAIESIHPRRTGHERLRSRTVMKTHLRLLSKRTPGNHA